MPTVNTHDAETCLSRLGFMLGEFVVPDDFDQMKNDEFFDECEADKRKRLGEEGAKLKRIRYKQISKQELRAVAD